MCFSSAKGVLLYKELLCTIQWLPYEVLLTSVPTLLQAKAFLFRPETVERLDGNADCILI